MRPTQLLLPFAFLLFAAPACKSREWKQNLISARSPVATYVEHREKDGKTVLQGFAHPPSLSPDRLKAILRSLKYHPSGFLGIGQAAAAKPIFVEEEVVALGDPVSKDLGRLGPDDRLRLLLARTSWSPLAKGARGISAVIFFDRPDSMNLAFDWIDENLPDDSGDPRAVVFDKDPTALTAEKAEIVTPPWASLHPPAKAGELYPRWVVLNPLQIPAAAEVPPPAPVPPAPAAPPVATAPAAPPVPADQGAEAIKRKLKNLDDLRKDGVISAEEYEKIRKEILLQNSK